MEWISSIWTCKKLICELESLFIMFLLDEDFFLGTKIFMSSLQGNLLPVSWWLDAMASPKSWDGSPLKIWFEFPNWSSHTHTHTPTMYGKVYYSHNEAFWREQYRSLKLIGNVLKELWKEGAQLQVFVVVRDWGWSEGFSAWFTLTVGDKAPRLSYQHAQLRDGRGRGRGKA